VKSDGVNLHELTRRLGDRNLSPQPALVDAVVPVGVFFDGTALVPPLLPPTAFAGCNFVTTAGRFACFQFNSRNEGGSQIDRILVGSLLNAIDVTLQLRNAPSIFTASTVAPPQNVGQGPVLSTVDFGENAALQLGAGNLPTVTIQIGSNVNLGSFFIPPGNSLFVEIQNVAAFLEFLIYWREYPAKPAS
jgi:hypothetical protein